MISEQVNTIKKCKLDKKTFHWLQLWKEKAGGLISYADESKSNRIIATIEKVDKKPRKKVIRCSILLALLVLCYFLGTSSSGTSSESKSSSPKASPVTGEVDNRIQIPFGAEECKGKDYKEIERTLEDIGFTNISSSSIEDLKTSDVEKFETIESIKINAKDSFIAREKYEGTEAVEIIYHTYQKCAVNVHIDFIGNLLFNKYDVDFYESNNKLGTLKHGEDGDFSFEVYPGECKLQFENPENVSENGEYILDVTGEVNLALKIECSGNGIDIKEDYKEDTGILAENEAILMGDPQTFVGDSLENVQNTLEKCRFTNITSMPVYDSQPEGTDIGKVVSVSIDGNSSLTRGTVYKNNAEVILQYHENMAKDPEVIAEQKRAEELEQKFPKDIAKKIVTVAITNAFADDVFASDGNSYDESKYHSYSDIDGYFLIPQEEGTWTAKDVDTWRVEGIVFYGFTYNNYIKASCDVKSEEGQYIVSNVDTVLAPKDLLDRDDESVGSRDHLEPSDFNSFLTVPEKLISEERDEAAANEKLEVQLEAMDEQKKHSDWVGSQFSPRNGSHRELEKLIKKNLNDEKSYDHINTDFEEIVTEEQKDIINNALKESGLSQRVDLGDLFITTEFSAKNAFNATIKSKAYGIADYSEQTITLLLIE